jgi:hypothetical protein
MLCCSLIVIFFAQPLLLFDRIAARLGTIGSGTRFMVAVAGAISPLRVTAVMAGELAFAVLALRFATHALLSPGLSNLCRVGP